MLHDLVFECAARYSQQVCVVFDSGKDETTQHQRITYSQLQQQITELKLVFEDLSLKEQIVGVLLADSLTIPSILIGLLSSSCTFFPVNSEGLQYTITALINAGVTYILAHSELIEQLSPLLKQLRGSQVQSVVLSKNGLQLFRLEHISFPAISLVKLHNLAYCITTSGTTSAPKVVYVPHSCIMPNIIHLRNIFHLGLNDRVLLTSPLTFDPSIVDIFCTLSSGACLVIVPSEVKRRPEQLLNIIHYRQAITVMQATPTLMRSFLSSKLQHTLLGPNSSLRVLALGGEKFPTGYDLKGWFHPENTTTQCYNVYGITEVSCWASCQRVDVRTVLNGTESVPIGTALDETVIKLMPSSNSGDTVNSDGDIWIGSEKRICFIDNEVYENIEEKCDGRVKEKPEMIWRGTGDMGKLLADGSILCLGRRDDQVKRHGKRLNLEAVEMVCKEIKGVLDCCALLDQSNLMLFIIIDSPTGINLEDSHEYQSTLIGDEDKLLPEYPTNEKDDLSLHLDDTLWINMQQRLKAHIEDSLPSHYAPSVFVKINGSFPLTQNGKLDRKMLVKKGYSEMKTDIGTDIRNAWKFSQEFWKAHLPDPSVIINKSDNFISLGGDSLAALRVINTIENVFSCSLPNLLDLLINKNFGHFVEELQQYLSLRLSDLTPPSFSRSENMSDFSVTDNLPITSSNDRHQGQITIHDKYQRKETMHGQKPVLNMNFTSTEQKDIHSERLKHKVIFSEVSRSKKAKLIDLSTTDEAKLVNDQSNDLSSISSMVQCNGHSELPLKTYNGSSPNKTWRFEKAKNNPALISHIKSLSQKYKLSPTLTRIVSRGKLWTNHSYSGNMEWSRKDAQLTHNIIPKCHHDNSMKPGAPAHIDHRSHDELTPHTLKPVLRMRLMWKFDTKKCVDASPLIVEDNGRLLAYVGSHSGQFSAIDILTGSPVWSVTLPDRIESSACCSQCGAFVIVGCYDGNIYVIDKSSGSIFWKFLTRDAVKCSPVIDNCAGFVVCGSHDGFLYCLDLKVKKCVWRCYMEGGSVFSSPVIDVSQRLVYAASLAGRVLCICADSGIVKWTRELHKPVFSSLCLLSQSVLVGCVNGKLYCISSSGHIEWTFVTQGPIFSTPTIYNSSVLVGCHDHHVYCLTLAGHLVWSFKASSPVYSTSFASVVFTCLENIVEMCSVKNLGNPKVSGPFMHIEHIKESGSSQYIENTKEYDSMKYLGNCKESGCSQHVRNTEESGSIKNLENIKDSDSSQLVENAKEYGSFDNLETTQEAVSSQYVQNIKKYGSIKNVENFKEPDSSHHVENTKEFDSMKYLENIKKSDSNQLEENTKNLSSYLQYETNFPIQSTERSPQQLSSIVLTASTNGNLYVIDLKDGQVQTKIKLPGEIFSSPVIIDNFVIVGCRDNIVYCFEIT